MNCLSFTSAGYKLKCLCTRWKSKHVFSQRDIVAQITANNGASPLMPDILPRIICVHGKPISCTLHPTDCQYERYNEGLRISNFSSLAVVFWGMALTVDNMRTRKATRSLDPRIFSENFAKNRPAYSKARPTRIKTKWTTGKKFNWCSPRPPEPCSASHASIDMHIRRKWEPACYHNKSCPQNLRHHRLLPAPRRR